MYKKLFSFALTALVFLSLNVFQASGTGLVFAGEDWISETPAQHGLDEKKLASLITGIKKKALFPDTHSLLVIRNGVLVSETYFSGWRANRLHMLQSVSKSFTSALIGIAVDRGEIKDVDEKILDFFPHFASENKEESRTRISIENLLTMRSGTAYHERGSNSPHSRLNRLSRGWDSFYIRQPMVSEPGTKFLYDSGGVIFLSAILKQETGFHADEYAAKTLFPALGIEQWEWSKNRDNHPHTGGGLDLLPRDMAKLGQLYLQDGMWNGQQVISQEWIKTSFQKHVSWDLRKDHTLGYGYLWWLLEPDPAGSGKEYIYAAMGFRGQYIFVVPEHDLVVVITAGARGRAQNALIDVLYDYILPAIIN